MTTHRRVPRLSPQNYFGRQTYFITICCDHRVPYFRELVTAQNTVAQLLQCAAKHSFLLHAFCLMPDHVHILAEGTHDRSDLREFVRMFKQRTAFQFRKSNGRTLWEMSYYDHILRQSDQMEEVACYIWCNSVRQKLCNDPSDFPFSGSQTIDWIRRAVLGTSWVAPWKS